MARAGVARLVRRQAQPPPVCARLWFCVFSIIAPQIRTGARVLRCEVESKREREGEAAARKAWGKVPGRKKAKGWGNVAKVARVPEKRTRSKGPNAEPGQSAGSFRNGQERATPPQRQRPKTGSGEKHRPRTWTFGERRPRNFVHFYKKNCPEPSASLFVVNSQFLNLRPILE